MDRLTIPCTDCEDTRRRLRMRDFIVHDCAEDPAQPGWCTVSFERAPLLAETAFAATTAAGSDAEALTPTQVATARAIVNLFETSSVRGKYGQVTRIPGDTGRLTYGRSQTTLGSGGLAELLQRYCANPGARFAARLRPELPRIAEKQASVDTDLKLHNVLRAAADDPVMREVQDHFFEERFWRPALKSARGRGIATPLGVAVVYDSHVHGSWGDRAAEVDAGTGTVAAVGERAWIAAYVARRRAWLAGHTREDLRPTVYRMDAFQRLIDLQQWGLSLPLVVRDAEISVTTLAADPPDVYSGPVPGTRALAFGHADLQRGLDVRLLQLGLSERGMDLRADGVFGRASRDAVAAFQVATGRPVSGVADPALVVELAGTA